MSETPAAEDLNARRRDLVGARRRAEILQLLQTGDTNAMTVEQIAERFGVSFATVRRDLARLHQEHSITRTYGGVTLTGPVGELSINQRHQERSPEKEAIGRLAADLVRDGEVIIVDAGTTTEAVARNLIGTELTVFTNGIGAINILMHNDSISVVVLGGRLRSINETITGSEAESMLKSVVASHAFIGVDAIDPEFGVASRTLEQSRLKSLMMQRARNVVIVADSTKLQPRELTYWSELPEKWRLITDDAADPTALDALRASGSVQIDLASPLRVLATTDTAKGEN